MVQQQADKWPANNAEYGPFTPKMTMDQMKKVLVNVTYGFMTNVPCYTEPYALSKSKTAGSHPLAHQKERTIEQAQHDGNVKPSALAQKLDAQGINAAAVSVSKPLANLSLYLLFTCFL